MSVDLMVIGAHPDDAELGVGGVIHRLSREGKSVVILDLSRGEKATRGSVEERAREAASAAKVLGVAVRENAALPDGGIDDHLEQRLRVAHFIRKHRPRVLLAPMAPDRHPDHTAAHALCTAANFEAGLKAREDKYPPHRVEAIYHYYSYTEPQALPQLVMDISADFQAKLEALKQYQSQFHNPEYPGAPTFVASEAFWEGIATRAAYWGHRIGVDYGEPLFAQLPLKLASLPEWCT